MVGSICFRTLTDPCFGKCNPIKLGLIITLPFLCEKNVGPSMFGRGEEEASVKVTWPTSDWSS